MSCSQALSDEITFNTNDVIVLDTYVSGMCYAKILSLSNLKFVLKVKMHYVHLERNFVYAQASQASLVKSRLLRNGKNVSSTICKMF